MQDKGDLAGAEAEFRAVLDISTRLLGDEDDYTLIFRDSLALVLHERGDLIDAEAEFRAVVEIRTRTLGAEHPDTVSCSRRLAETLAELSRN